MMFDLPDEQRPQPTAKLLERWVRDAEGITKGTRKRIGWMVASTVAIAALQRSLAPDQQPLFLVKGGVYLELCFGMKARATKDIDTLFRGSAAQFERGLDEVLAEPWGPIAFERTALERVTKAPRVVKPYRFAVLLTLRGKTWRRVQVEVSFPEGQVGSATTPVPAPGIGFFGLKTPDEIVGIAMDYQIAQKAHAATDPDAPPDIINDRVRDIIDLVLIREILYADDPTPPALRAACLDVFAARAEEARSIGTVPRHWPPVFVANAAWNEAYPDLAKSVDMPYRLSEAMAIVQTWIDAIDRSAP
jgi:hypothetical protein